MPNSDLDKNKTLTEIKACVEALEDKKAENIQILYLGEKSSIADYFVIATGNSNPHLKALSANLEHAMKENGVDATSSADHHSGWMVVDAYDVIYHILTEEMRETYTLEKLWKDAEVIEL